MSRCLPGPANALAQRSFIHLRSRVRHFDCPVERAPATMDPANMDPADKILASGPRRADLPPRADQNSVAAAFCWTCATFLQPGITDVTTGSFRHQANAHCAIGTPSGTSSEATCSTS